MASTVNDFHENFKLLIDDMKKRHAVERKRLLKIKQKSEVYKMHIDQAAYDEEDARGLP